PAAAGGRAARLDGPGRLGARQLDDGVLLRDAAAGAARPPDLGDAGRTDAGDLRVDRRLVQPAPTTHVDRRPQPAGVRTEASGDRTCGMISRSELSGKPGQAHSVGWRALCLPQPLTVEEG